MNIPTPKQVASRKRRADEALNLMSVRTASKLAYSTTTGDAPKSDTAGKPVKS